MKVGPWVLLLGGEEGVGNEDRNARKTSAWWLVSSLDGDGLILDTLLLDFSISLKQQIFQIKLDIV